jgi:hypothetical protein
MAADHLQLGSSDLVTTTIRLISFLSNKSYAMWICEQQVLRTRRLCVDVKGIYTLFVLYPRDKNRRKGHKESRIIASSELNEARFHINRPFGQNAAEFSRLAE